MTTPVWTSSELERWTKGTVSHRTNALAFYRSDWNAITTDPKWMTVPVDDHLVHRGDGVFETLLCEEGAIYNLAAHLVRLRKSAAALHLELPWSDSELGDRILDTFRASSTSHSLGRVLIGRGPGGFSVDPAECLSASLYVIVYPAKPPFMESHPDGARLILSEVPPKSGGLATIKTCNYIPNALAKREANQRGAHFALGVDADGFLTESATENIAVIPEVNVLLIPPATHHLAGTTLARVSELMKKQGWTVKEEPIRPEQLFEMKEVLIVGTTAYVTQAVELEGQPLPKGPQAERWMNALVRDVRTNPGMRTCLS